MPAAGKVPELRGGAGVLDLLAAAVVHRVRLRRGEGDDAQAVPLVRVVDRNGHDLGVASGVLVSLFWWIVAVVALVELAAWAVVLWVIAIRGLL